MKSVRIIAKVQVSKSVASVYGLQYSVIRNRRNKMSHSVSFFTFENYHNDTSAELSIMDTKRWNY